MISYLLIIFSLLWLIDFFFGFNFFGRLSSSFGSWSKESPETNISSTKFYNVGGLHEAKEELGEIVNYFRNPQAF